MPSSSSPDGIAYPVSSDVVAPLEDHFQDLATTAQDALDEYKITIVADEASLPTPASGYQLIAQAADTGWLYYSDGSNWEKVMIPGDLATRREAMGIYVQSSDPGASTVGAGAIRFITP